MQGIIILKNMSTLNAPESREEDEKAQAKKQETLSTLLDASIESTLCKDGKMDPIIYNKSNGDVSRLAQLSRDTMKILRTEEKYKHITEDDVGMLSDSKIIKAVLEKTEPLKQARNRADRVLKQTFRNLNQAISDNDLTSSLSLLDEESIIDIIESRRSMSEFLYREFGILRWSLEAKIYEFDDVLAGLDPKTREETKASIIQYKKYHRPLPLHIIQNIISANSDEQDNIKKICESFDVEFTLRDAYNIWILDDNNILTYAEKLYAPIWDRLEQEEKNTLCAELRVNSSIKMQYADLESDKFAEALKRDTTKKMLGREIHKNIAYTILDKTWDSQKSIYNELFPDNRWKMHGSFLEYIQRYPRLRQNIIWLNDLIVWSIIVTIGTDGNRRYTQIDETDVAISTSDKNPEDTIIWVSLSDITGTIPNSLWTPKNKQDVSYQELFDFLSALPPDTEVLTAEDIDRKRTKDTNSSDDFIFDNSPNEEAKNLEWMKQEIDIIDPEGKKIWWKKWVAFSGTWTKEDGTEHKWVWEISDIDEEDKKITFWHWEEATFEEFVTAIKNSSKNFTRIASVESDIEMLISLREYGIDEGAEIDSNGDICTKTKEDDWHGHTKEVKKQYEFFQSESGWHIRIGWLKNWQVFFWEYKSSTEISKVQEAWNAGKLTEKQKEWLYEWNTMGYGEFLNYLKENKLKATTDNLLVPNATSKYHPHEPHLEWSLLSKMGKWWSVADIIKGFGNLTHAVEHYLEKNSKLNASRVALSMGRKMWLPLDIMAQLQADEVNSIKEIIEKYQEKLRNLNGPDGRKKALHMAHNKNARPEEIAAAMLHMLKSYGQLYAEDIAYAQWSESFINWFMNACGYTGDALTEQKIKARNKAKTMIGDEWEEPREPTEEEMIWAFCKSMDGAYGENPIAATIVKALWWPSGYEAAWRKEGTVNAIEKWKRQAWDLVNARARGDHWLSALLTFEYHTAMGSMESTAAKTPHPMYQTIPVLWALWGYSRYLSTKGNQEVKKYADGMWHSMHAFAFLRSYEDNKTYQAAFKKVLGEIWWQDKVDQLEKWLHELEKDGHTEPNKDKKKRMEAAVNGIADLWRRYYDRWLHETLQWKNTWLIEQANAGDKDIQKYLKRLSDIHQNNDGETPHSPDNDWNIQLGYAFHPLIESRTDNSGKIVQTLWRSIKKIKISPQTMNFSNKNDIERFWVPSVNKVLDLRNKPTSEYTMAQYKQYRMDILRLWNDTIWAYWNGRENGFDSFKKQSHYPDFVKMWIDAKILFESGDFESRVLRTAERDYQNFLRETTMDDHQQWAQKKVIQLVNDSLSWRGDSTRKWAIDPDEKQSRPGKSAIESFADWDVS